LYVEKKEQNVNEFNAGINYYEIKMLTNQAKRLTGGVFYVCTFCTNLNNQRQNRRMTPQNFNAVDHWKEIVAHTWSGAYLLGNCGAHFRKFAKVLSKAQTRTTSDWTGIHVWGSPIVSLAPPLSSVNK